MNWIDQYLRSKATLLSDSSICRANLDLFRRFFEFQEYKLKRRNNLPELDDACIKTLLSYIHRLRSVNRWFDNKPWKSLTKADIKRVYDDLEEGRLTNTKGRPYKDRRSYYNKIFKSKPFRLAGKDDLAREVIEFYADGHDREVRFVDEQNFLKMVSVLSKPTHLVLFWLAWDVGENINTLLQLRKRDFVRQENPDTRDPEYLVNLPREMLKRTRKSRSEPTLYPQTVHFLGIVLAPLKDEDQAFPFEYRQASKILSSAVTRSGATCMPHNDAPTWKDLRSGMACHLLKEGWTTDEVNFRLGHKPSSREIDAYVSYLAIDRRKPKKKLTDNDLQRVKLELEEAKTREKLIAERVRRHEDENRQMRLHLDQMRREMRDLQAGLRGRMGQKARP